MNNGKDTTNNLKEHPEKKRYRGIIIFDVDGVILRGYFLVKILRSSGLVNYLKMLKTALFYYRGKISFNTMIQRGYSYAARINVNKAMKVLSKIKRVTNLKRAISILKENGYYISIISAGVPDFLLKSIATEIGVDHYRGLDISITRGTLNLNNLNVKPKVKIVEELVDKLGLSWSNVISIADDPNNLELLEKSRLSIGYNPSKLIREKADVVIETNDFLEIIPYIIPSNKLPPELRQERYSWKREIFRKGIHILGCGIPFLASIDKGITIIILVLTTILYILSEFLRKEGIKLLLFSTITTRALRYNEKRGIVLGPVFLAAGIALTLVLFRKEIYFPAILVGCISDSASALIGKKLGRIRIPFSTMRTLEGSGGFFITASIIISFFYPLKIALPVAFISTMLELIPLYNLDNLLIPIGTGFLLVLFNTPAMLLPFQ